jgi:hypothetical protein
MEKKFTHNNNDYTARTNTTGEEIQVGVFAQNNKRRYLISVSTETANDAKITNDKLAEYAINDFKRLVDEEILSQ